MDADTGERLKVRVQFTDDAGNAERLTSGPATDPVAVDYRTLDASATSPVPDPRGRPLPTLVVARVGIADELECGPPQGRPLQLARGKRRSTCVRG